MKRDFIEAAVVFAKRTGVAALAVLSLGTAAHAKSDPFAEGTARAGEPATAVAIQSQKQNAATAKDAAARAKRAAVYTDPMKPVAAQPTATVAHRAQLKSAHATHHAIPQAKHSSDPAPKLKAWRNNPNDFTKNFGGFGP